MPRHTDFSAERGRPNKIGSERLQGLVTTASLSFWLPGCLSKLSCNQNQRLGYSALIKAVHKEDFPLYNSDIHLSFAGLISGGADGQESDEPQGSVSKENHNDHKYNLGRTENARLWTDSYSAKLFPLESEILVDDRALEKAEAGEYVLCEQVDPGKYQDRIEKVPCVFLEPEISFLKPINYCGGTLMGTYITHEGLPFHGALEKIRIRSCRVADLSLPGFDEKQLLEITPDGTAKLTQKTPEGTKKAKTRISQADTDYIFAAFSETFANYRRKRIPSVSGHWRVRLLTDDDEVYFYHGANGQDYRYHDESLTDILRQRTGMPELFGLCVKAETKNKVKSIEISLEQTAADEVKDQYVNEYGICIHDTNEWLLVSSEGTITYNRRIARVGRVSLQYELKDKVAEFLKVYDDQSVFSHPKGHSPDTVQDEVRKTYRIVVTRDSGDTSVLEGSFDKDGLPDNWPDFVGRLTDFFQGQSLGMLFDSRVYSKVLRKCNEVAFCGVDIDGVVRTRYYRCGDEICEGDTVVVPTPRKHTMAIGRVVEIRNYPKDQIPKDMARVQEILGLAKETE